MTLLPPDRAPLVHGLGLRSRRARIPATWCRWLLATLLLATNLGTGALRSTAEVLPGIDVLEQAGFAQLRGKRVGLISNPTGVDRRGEPTWRLLRQAPGVKLIALFGAEHGFDGHARAGSEVADWTDAATGLPVYSLYGPGKVRRPTPRMLAGIDTLIYDIQDTGCRSYTFISTLGLAMEACAAAGVGFLVLDRPNPLGGTRVEGPGLDPRFKSFVGQWPVPYAYGLTPGELARMINGEGWITNRCQLDVVAMKGWHRRMTWKDTGLRWTASSPNVPSGETPLYLCATGILGEIGGLNLGTGSSLSFQVITAPWLDSRRFSQRLNAARLPGIVFEPIDLDFNRNPRDGAELHGTRLRITQPASAPIVSVGFHALEAIKAGSGRDLFKQAVERGRSWEMFDKVTGSDRTRLALGQGRGAREIVASWKPGEDAFRERRQKYLLYPNEATANPASTVPPARPPAKRRAAPR